MLDEVWATVRRGSSTNRTRNLDKGGPTLEDGWYDFVYQPLFGDDGRVMGIMQHGIEVTDQVRARMEVERLFHESERQRQATEVARKEARVCPTARRGDPGPVPRAGRCDSHAGVDRRQGRFHRLVQCALVRIHGHHSGGHGGLGVDIGARPEVLPIVLERWKESIATGEPFEMTFPLRGRDGVFRQFLTRVVPTRDGDGRVVRWFGTNTDVEDAASACEWPPRRPTARRASSSRS